MKKLLLGSTALIGVVAFNAPALADATIEFSGNIDYRYNYTDNDIDGTNDDDGGDLHNNGTELKITATYETDSGMTYGGVVDYAFQSGTDGSYDEAYLFFEGDWGTVEIGDNDGARGMTYSGEAALSGTTGFDGGATKNVNAPTNFMAPTGPGTAGETGDASKITYYTPDLSGFKFGASYTPRTGDMGAGNVTVDSSSDVFELGATYDGTFDSVTFGISAGYRFGDVEDSAKEDISAYEIGAKIGYAGFMLAGGFADSGDSNQDDATFDDADYWNIGLGYSTDVWGIGIGYFDGEAEMQNDTEDEYEMFTVGGHYNLLEGLKTYAEVNFMEYDSAKTTDDDDEATSFIIGSKLTF